MAMTRSFGFGLTLVFIGAAAHCIALGARRESDLALGRLAGGGRGGAGG